MTYLVKLGVVVACVVAACSSSKDALFNDGGPAPDAQFEPDARFDATTSDPCDGAGQVVRDGVLMCNFGELDGGGAAGSGGGAAGSGGGAGGSGGAAGSGGAVAGSGGNPRGGSGGAVAGSGGSAGTSSRGGTGGGCGNEAIGLCARPYECVRSCGGPIESNSCCQCQAPLFDNFNDIACRNMGTPTISYAGCGYFGDLNHVTIAKRDITRDLCVKLVFVDPATSSSGISFRWSNPALSSVPNWGLEMYGAGPAAACATPGQLPSAGQSVAGMVTVTRDTTSGNPVSVSFDLSVTYQSAAGAKTERMSASDVVTSGSCNVPLFP
jgi:hypothetical protein